MSTLTRLWNKSRADIVKPSRVLVYSEGGQHDIRSLSRDRFSTTAAIALIITPTNRISPNLPLLAHRAPIYYGLQLLQLPNGNNRTQTQYTIPSPKIENFKA